MKHFASTIVVNIVPNHTIQPYYTIQHLAGPQNTPADQAGCPMHGRIPSRRIQSEIMAGVVKSVKFLAIILYKQGCTMYKKEEACNSLLVCTLFVAIGYYTIALGWIK